MREPGAHTHPFGLLAEFDAAEKLVDAIGRVREAGYVRLDAYSPFPFEDLSKALSLKGDAVLWLTLLGGVLGAVSGYGLQLYTNHDFPIDIGGRPLYAWQAFMLITFELTVLFAVGFAVFGMLLLNHLPRLHHPVFDVADFERASVDRFFLIIFGDDRLYDPQATRAVLEGLAPLKVTEVGKAEEAE